VCWLFTQGQHWRHVISKFKVSFNVYIPYKFLSAYSHVIDGKISPGRIIEQKCPTRMAIYIPVDASIHKAIVFLHNPHNHPMYPKTKPSTEEKSQLRKAINAAGKRGLTVRKLINGIVSRFSSSNWYLPFKNSAPSTSSIYNSMALPIASPAYMDRCKLSNEICKEKMKDHPKGLGWEGRCDLSPWEELIE